jgi:DNA primase large subunit
MEGLGFLSRYPFLKGAREWVRTQELTITDMLSPDNEAIQRNALERVEDAIEGREIRVEVKDRTHEEIELLSYPVSRFIVAAVGDTNLIKWFSHHEGERARTFMEKEETSSIASIGEELGLPALENLPGEVVPSGARTRIKKGVRPAGSAVDGERRSYWVRFTGYLPPKANISGPEWDLIHQRMKGGYVELNRHSYIRLLQELVKGRVEEGLDQKVGLPRNQSLVDMIKGLKTKVESRRKRYSPTELGRITVTRLPPCIRQILGMSQAGENLPHHARFALVTFLNAIGMSPEEIFKVFTTAPDFKADIVRYQVEHITGSSSATSYYVPNCDTMKTGGICFNPDSLCEKEWLTNPMKYYRVKGKRRKKGRATSEGTSA